MKTSALLALANAGSVAFAAVEVYHQCGGKAYTGDTDCASGSTCSFMNEWYSQCIPGSDNNAVNTPSWGNGGQSQSTPGFGSGGQSQNTPSSGNGGQPESTPTTSVVEEQEESTESAAATTPVATTTPSSGSATITGVTRTLPASSGAVSSSEPITVTGTFDGGMKNYDRSRESP